MKKFQPLGGSLASVLILLTLSALPMLATTWNEPLLAQSTPTDPNAPTDTPIPVGSDDRHNNLWWLLILIPVGGIVWASSRSRRHNPEVDATVTPPIVPNVPLSSVAPVLLDGTAPDRDRVDPNLVVARERQRANGLTDRDAVIVPSANGNSRTKEPLVTTPLVVVPIDQRSTQSAVVGEELIMNHEIPKTPLARASEPDGHLTKQIRLLEERLVVDRHKRKVGEVVVRKEVETRFIRVPIQREILIVEQVEPEFKQLAVVDLGQIHDDSIALDDGTSPTVVASFTSTATAIEFLKSLVTRSPSKSQDLQLNIAIDDADTQAFYRQWLAQRSVEVN